MDYGGKNTDVRGRGEAGLLFEAAGGDAGDVVEVLLHVVVGWAGEIVSKFLWKGLEKLTRDVGRW